MFNSIKQKTGLHVSAAKGRLILAESGVNVVGVRLELKIRKAVFSKKSYEDIKVFMAELERVQGINYATLVFEDGTGIFFVNCMTCCPEYGKVDKDGCIDGFPVGFVQDTGSYFVLADDQDKPLSDGTDTRGINGIREPLDRFSYVHNNCEPLEI